MSSSASFAGSAVAPFRDASEVLRTTESMVGEAIHRSAVWSRMSDGTLPFAGRAAYLEQHWEGLRALSSAFASFPSDATPPEVLALGRLLACFGANLGTVLDKAHATPRWREQQVTMPSMLQFRRRVTEMTEQGDVVGLVAHAVVRLVAVKACPSPHQGEELEFPELRLITSDEQEEFFSEELSAATLMVLAHGADVCRAYKPEQSAQSCGVTAAMIRRALH